MDTVRSLVASLGTLGAARNAEHALRAREAEDRAIEGLTQALADDISSPFAPAAA
jgi:hypothetical protein